MSSEQNVSAGGIGISAATPPCFCVLKRAGDLVIVIGAGDAFVATNARQVGDNIVHDFDSWDRDGRPSPPTKAPLAAWRTLDGAWHVIDSRVSTILGKIDDRFEP